MCQCWSPGVFVGYLVNTEIVQEIVDATLTFMVLKKV